MAIRPTRPSGAMLGVALAALLLTLLPAAPASSAGRGPALETPVAVLDAALRCTDDVRTADKRAVLLVHGTGATPEENFSWNFTDKLAKRGYPWCTVTIPDRALGDVQVNVEYVVHAIRRVHRLSGRRIAIIGHSQGAFLPTYALRIWPDLSRRVDDVISFAGAFTYGTDQASLLCVLPCSPAFQQFRPGSNLLTALAVHPLPKGPSYTSFATRLDEIVTPQPSASTLEAPGARNYLLQDHCPADVAEHLTIIGEKPFFQLTFDALRHRGPARLGRIGSLRCGLDQRVVAALPSLATFGLGIATGYPLLTTTQEPALRPYWSAR